MLKTVPGSSDGARVRADGSRRLCVLSSSGDGELLEAIRRNVSLPVHTVPTCLEAVRAALENGAEPAVVLVDHPPALDARAVLGELARGLPGVPCLVVTPGPDVARERALLEAGARDCISRDRLAVLGPALDRELRAAAEREGLREELRTARLEAATKEARFRAALVGAEAGRFELDLATGVATWSPSLEQLHGMEPGSFRGDLSEWEACVHPDDLEAARVSLREALEKGRNAKAPLFRIRRRDTGETRWLVARGSVVPDPAGGPGHLVGLNVDVTDQVLAGERNAVERGVLASILEGLPVAVAVIAGPERTYRFANRAYRQIAPGRELVGRTVAELFPEGWPRLEPIHARILATGIPHEELDQPLPLQRTAGGPVELGRFSWSAHRVDLPGDEVPALLVATWETTERWRMAEELRSAVERLDLALEAAHAGWWEWDLATDENAWSPGLFRLYGLDPARDRPSYAAWRRSIHPDDVAAAEAEVQAAVREGRDLRAEWRVRTPDGSERWLLSRGRPRTDAGGRPTHYLGVVIDVSDTRQVANELRESAARIQALVDSPVVGIQFGDVHGGIARTNDEFLRIVGYTRQDFDAGLVRWTEITAPEFHELDARRIEEARQSGSAQPYEKQYVRKDGARVWALVGFVLFGPQREESIAFILDISARKQAEEALRALTADLEHRVKQRTNELEAANRELEAFSYSVSHDLRAPLRAIGGYAEVLEEECAEALGAEGRRLLGMVRRNAREMSRLIEDLLALARVGRTEMQSRRLSMALLARDAWERATVEAGPRKPELVVGPLPEVCGDANLLLQVWMNLLSNACKFTATVERPRVELFATAGGDEVTYSVRDNGAGFDMRHVGQLFQPFKRLHSGHQFSGNGVGLSLVRRIIERHGGRVSAVGTPGDGATFSFTLPAPRCD